MKYRELGRTGLKVSVIGLGSAELGMGYGIKIPGQYGKPDKETARKILHKALDSGVNLFDTAPTYGEVEALLGSAIGTEPCYIATKINIAENDKNAPKSIRASIERSLKNLKRECLDIVQIHTTATDSIRQVNNLGVLEDLRKEGLIRFLGASVYGPADAMAVNKKDCFDVLQIAYSILDQRMSEEVMPEARKNKIGIISRSAYFRGMLTKKIEYLDDNWAFLKKVVNEVKAKMNIDDWDDLPKLALEFCLSSEGVDTVLVGVRTMDELECAIEAEKEASLPETVFKELSTLGIKDNYWVEPLNWHLKL